MPNRVLVTGAGGFLGWNCLRRLQAAGWEVHAAGRAGRPGLPERVVAHTVDLLVADGPARLIETVRPTHLLHLAWITTPGVYGSSPENADWVEGSLRLLHAFTKHKGQRAVLAGSCAEYDWSAGGVCHETYSPIRPATIYGRCKDDLRRRAEELAKETGMSLAWGRIFFLYGPAEHPDRLVPSVTRALLKAAPAECSHGAQRRDFTHVADAADIFVRLLADQLTGTINIGSGEAVSIREVVEIVAKRIGRPDLVRYRDPSEPQQEPPLVVADTSRLKKELRWQPRRNLSEGLADTVSWWRDQRVSEAKRLRSACNRSFARNETTAMSLDG